MTVSLWPWHRGTRRDYFDFGALHPVTKVSFWRHNYVGRNYEGHNYILPNYVDHTCIGHKSVARCVLEASGFPLRHGFDSRSRDLTCCLRVRTAAQECAQDDRGLRDEGRQ